VPRYTQAFGLRLLFHLKVSPHHSIAYLGHSHGGRNGTGYQSSDELNRNKNNVEGLIELLEVTSPSWDLPPGTTAPNTFSHLGVVVPNITDTQVRLDALGAKSWKRSGQPFKVEGEFAFASGFTQAGEVITDEEKKLIEAVLAPINDQMIYAADPDGTIVEVQQQW
jgi:lactoylglutathione lyase